LKAQYKSTPINNSHVHTAKGITSSIQSLLISCLKFVWIRKYSDSINQDQNTAKHNSVERTWPKLSLYSVASCMLWTINHSFKFHYQLPLQPNFCNRPRPPKLLSWMRQTPPIN